MTLIDVTDVTPAKTALPEVPYKEAVEALLTTPPSQKPGVLQRVVGPPNRPVEACSRYYGRLVADVQFHPVVAATHLAFGSHRPLVLSPDMLWLLVAQGFAHHVNANTEELRPKLVEHTDTVAIKVRRDDFIRGSLENPWPEVFGEFSGEIRKHIGATTHDLLLPSFSTTGATERAAAEIVLLGAMRSFFSYELYTLCGIPQIALEGTTDDWLLLAERTRGLGRFGLEWWTEALGPILDEFVAASRGQVNLPFWQSIYKLHEVSGGPYTTGWINAFFPYLKEAGSGLNLNPRLKDQGTGPAINRNPWLAQGGRRLQELLHPKTSRFPFDAPTIDRFPSGLARAPFVWIFLDGSLEMEFLGGFVGVRQESDTHRLRPEIGWAVREATA